MIRLSGYQRREASRFRPPLTQGVREILIGHHVFGSCRRRCRRGRSWAAKEELLWVPAQGDVGLFGPADPDRDLDLFGRLDS